jgi:hypothetical protein
MKSIEVCTEDEILKIMAEQHDGDTDRRADAEHYDKFDLTYAYLTKCTAGQSGPSAWAHMRAAIADVINIEIYQGALTEPIRNGSQLDKMIKGILSAVEDRKAREIGAMLGVDGSTLEAAAKAVADGERQGDDIKLLVDTKGLRAAIQGIADNASSPNGRMLPRKLTKDD